MRTITIRYFAILKEQRGLGEEQVETPATTPAELYEELRSRHGFTLRSSMIRAAVDDDFVPMNHALRDGDVVVFIAPVAGG